MNDRIYTPSGKAINTPSAIQNASDGSCNIGQANYRPTPQFTLRADNSAGVAIVVFKQPSFDGVVEAINGSIGASFMSVVEMPNGAGTVAKQNGTNIFSGEALGAYLATYGMVISKLQASGDGITTPALTILNVQRFLGNIQNVDRGDLQLNVDRNLSSQLGTLSLTKEWTFTANTALAVSVGIGLIIDLTFFCKGLRPYSTLI